MRFIALDGFLEGFDRLPAQLQAKTWRQLHLLVGSIGRPQKAKSLRLKKLPRDNFEISITMDLRAVFRLHHGDIVLVLLGDHEDVRRFLKR